MLYFSDKSAAYLALREPCVKVLPLSGLHNVPMIQKAVNNAVRTLVKHCNDAGILAQIHPLQ